MLYLIPRRLHRLAYRSAHAVRIVWWRIARPIVHGACVMAQDPQHRVLLIRPSYGPQTWQFPGGGMAEGEDPVEAAAREFIEETGLQLYRPQHLGELRENLHGAVNVVHVVAGRAGGQLQIDRREILAAGWFALDSLPDNRSPTVDARLAEFAGRLQQG